MIYKIGIASAAILFAGFAIFYSGKQPPAATPLLLNNELDRAAPLMELPPTQNETPSDSDLPAPEAESPPQDVPESSRPRSVVHEVPFTPQAPFGEWDDDRQQDGCEEASVLMAQRWIVDEGLNAFSARREILKLVEWEKETFGYYNDTNAADTARMLKEYFQVRDVEVSYDVTVAAIQDALASGKVVLVPLDGRRIGNPYYTAPGPEQHMLVIVGYDDNSKEFITNDPGTKRGEGFRYSFDQLLSSVREYPSGDHLPITDMRRAMVVVGR